jgi:hypothetical protein
MVVFILVQLTYGARASTSAAFTAEKHRCNRPPRTEAAQTPRFLGGNSISTTRRTNAAGQDNFPETICERAPVLTETPSVLNRKNSTACHDQTTARRQSPGAKPSSNDKSTSGQKRHHGTFRPLNRFENIFRSKRKLLKW